MADSVSWHADPIPKDGAAEDAVVVGDGHKAAPQLHPYKPHQGEHRAYMRDVILGVNDGLVSVFLLVFGLVAADLRTRDIFLSAISGAVAGALSMAIGEYLATKAQSEVVAGDLKLEQEHFKYHREIEVEQLHHTLSGMNIKGDTLKAAVKAIGSSDEALMKFMRAFEFGSTDQDDRSPLKAMTLSGVLFLLGSAPSVIPFGCTNDAWLGLLIAGILCEVAMFAVGAIKTMATAGSWWRGGVENVVIGSVAAAFSYAIGTIYNQLR